MDRSSYNCKQRMPVCSILLWRELIAGDVPCATVNDQARLEGNSAWSLLSCVLHSNNFGELSETSPSIAVISRCACSGEDESWLDGWKSTKVGEGYLSW
jgi:hypothetical protein